MNRVVTVTDSNKAEGKVHANNLVIFELKEI